MIGGRLGEYKYYDMDAVIYSALDMCARELSVNSVANPQIDASTCMCGSVLREKPVAQGCDI